MLHAKNRGLAVNLFRYKRQVDELSSEVEALRRQRAEVIDTASALQRGIELVSLSRAASGRGGRGGRCCASALGMAAEVAGAP